MMYLNKYSFRNIQYLQGSFISLTHMETAALEDWDNRCDNRCDSWGKM